MKALRSPLALLLVLSLFLSPAASLAQSLPPSIQTSPPTIDGIVDPEYGLPVAIDPSSDADQDPVDLLNLWVTEDETHIFFAYEVNTDISVNNWGKYVIYLDTTGDANGATIDAWGRSVVAADPHKPEYAIYTYVDSLPYGLEDVPLYMWNGINWTNSLSVNAAAIGSGTTSIIEYSVAKTTLGNPDKLWVEVWSTGGGGGDNAQDTINFPSNDWQASDWSSLATLSVSTPIIQVDGFVEPTYGYPIAADPSGDGNGNANMDLLGLWAAEDASQYYFAYTINDDISTNNWGKYALYIDTTNDANGATSDAWGRNVVANDPHKPEFGVYTWVDAILYGPENTNFVTWTGTGWDWANVDSVNEAALTGGAPSVIEWAIEKNRLGNPATLWLEVWDTGGGDTDNAQDTINDPADEWNATDWSTQAVLGVSTLFPPPSEAPVPGHDNDVWWDYLGHDSRDTLYRTPGGPVTTDTEVILRLRAAQGDLTEAKLRLYNDRTNVQSILPMSVAYSDGTYDWWQVTVPASADPTVYWYRFIAIDGTDTDYYEDDAARTMGWGQPFEETEDYSYQLTVYDAAFQTPDWIKNAVVYQVFPDRFRDGDPDNNKPAGTFFYGEEGGTVYRSLTEDWNTAICDPRGEDECAGTYSKNFYGGDLAGLTEKLDYLESLGITTIYLNPIFASPSNHGYDTTDYLSINEMFGTQTEYDALIAGLELRGMHLIVDGVFNHVSSDSMYLDRYGRYPEVGACESHTSPYRDWFYFTDVPAGTGPCVGSDGTPNAANYESWWGYDSLPKLNSSNPEVRAWIWDNQDNPETTVAGHWMLTADGWRLDVGADVDPGTINDTSNDYWEGFRNTVKTVNPDGYITGEEWGIANSWLLGGEWDAVMNYQFSSAVLSLWRDSIFTDNDHNDGSSAGELAPLDISQFDERILNLQERYAPEALYAMMNLFGSHDTNRALFMLDENTNTTDPSFYLDPEYDWAPAIEKLKGAALVQMTMPGAPTIYYGDEVGLVGPIVKDGNVWQDDPYNRQPYPWLDASGTPFYTHLQTQAEQDELYDYYQSLTSARNEHVALRTGDYRTLLSDDTLKLYAYGRNLPGVDSAVVLINRNTDPQSFDIDVLGYIPVGTTYQDVLSPATYTVNGEGKLLAVSAPADGGAVLVRTNVQAAPPANILDLSALTTGMTVDLTWTPVANADEYLIYRSCLSGGDYELIDTSTIPAYTDTDVISGTTYYYVVVAKNNTTLLVSHYSNEVTALPAYTIGWANLQSPLTISHTIGTDPTEDIYGQVWIDGVTNLPGATPGLWAQVGFGPNISDPRGNTSWTWFDAEFNVGVGNNDEFVGTLLPEALGEFDYVYRYSTNGGVSWVYAYEGGLIVDSYDQTKAGDLTVTASTDTTPPSAPVLAIEDWSASSISLSWTAAIVDEGVYAYDIYRSTDNNTFSKIDRILAPDLTYTDTNVVTDQLYYYYVIALDTSFNLSLDSNTVSQTAEAKMVAVTFDITVPEWTPGVVYLVGSHPAVGDWNPGAVAMTKVNDTLWTLTADILDGTAFEFKVTRGSWETVMKGSDGNEELSNLPVTVNYGTNGTQLFEYTVLNWRDPIVLTTDPSNDATDVAVDASIVVTWSQAMPDAVCPNVWVEPDPTDLLDVTCNFDTATNEMIITPIDAWPSLALIGVGLSGLGDAGGDTQQVSYPLSFTTEFVDPMPFKLYLPLISR